MGDEKKRGVLGGIGAKILAIFVLVSVVAIAAVTGVSVVRSSQALRAQAFNQLASVHAIKQQQIRDYFKRVMDDIHVVARSTDAKDAIHAFVQYHVEMDIQADENYDLSSSAAAVTATYEEIYAEANANLAKYADVYGYYDVFLICGPHGHVMYTWAKEADLGENLSVGTYRDSGLARAWAAARESDGAVVVDMSPYEPSGNAPAMFLAEAIRDNGVVIGVLAIQTPLDEINDIMHARAGMGESGETYLVGKDLLMRSDSYLDPVNHSVEASLNGTVEVNGVDTHATREAFAGRPGHAVIEDYNGIPVLSSWATIDIGGVEWAIIAEIDEAEIEQPVRQLVIFVVAIAIAVLVLVVVVALLFSRTISKPLGLVTEAADSIAAGDFNVERIERKARDEIGAMADAFGQMTEELKKKAGLIETMAAGDFSQSIELASDRDALGISIRQMLLSLNEAFSQVNEAVDQVAAGSGQVSQASQDLSQGATESASSLEEISSSINQINGQSRQNADNATEANNLAREASSGAAQGNGHMVQLKEAMENISSSSDEIKKVVKVIDDIAFQINLLALNANVEAARAGKYGKGFAVVADEVRNLAVRSAEAVKETTAMVEESVKNIATGSEFTAKTAEQLEAIVSGSTKVAAFLEEIAAASKEQAQAIEQITDGLSQVDQITQANTASAEESASAAEELASQSNQLRTMIAQFKLSEEYQHGAGSDRESREPAAVPPPALVYAGNGSDGGATGDNGTGNDSHGSVQPKEVIRLDDDDFDRF